MTDPRFDWDQAAPGVTEALARLDGLAARGLDPTLAQLVRLRVSHLNGCAYCVELHGRQARTAGESAERLASLAGPGAATSGLFSEREAVALELAEWMARLAERGPLPEEVYQRAATVLPIAEVARLVAVATTTNAWNRLATAAALPPRRTDPSRAVP
ncbi:carboxymuconolactone decarboxylase family protein [Streptomyces sp. DSM 44915]|uniref:Carboxymuconolactone decarboxylase family protein n=1 Tax=Streptomyces chisholmiae TaxID=3075540 RepID=A0ABU2JQQ7_9ACTN|nr:carboxymuconolactone decarboxylase family protein [Streptomyces sp. DSM 44915]MDT0266543.1 carboxymuconolactone decarboxylase family protein [Streptomyces sp. DSM 44915]